MFYTCEALKKRMNKIKSFKEYVCEVNYGALEKDPRIKEIGDRISNNIADSHPKKSGNIKYKDLSFEWHITLDKPISTPIRVEVTQAGIKETEKNVFDLYVVIEYGQEKYLKDFFKNDLEDVIYHEVKHALDIVDKRFKKDKYYTPSDDFTDKEYNKYVSQGKEIDAMLITVLSDLKRLYKKYPSIKLLDAMRKSNSYQSFINALPSSKKTKYKQKIVYFWDTLK